MKILFRFLPPAKLPGILEGYNLCLSGDCDVVYFGRQIFRKNDVKVRVWYKETDHPVPN
ncbi:MAG: hypothetical protein K6T65_11405 [Peptococcaceae bacterium]|nr:hypothetical protein [Peptococcaceae bacterium]